MIKLSIVIGCCYFIYDKLTQNSEINFADFLLKLKENNVFSVKNISILVLFTFLNWFLEITKWKTLTSFCATMSFKTAAEQSFASLTTSLITPNRIGEYGAKALYFKPALRAQIIGVNLVGNFYQMLATVFFGGISFTYFISQYQITLESHKVIRFLIFSIGVLIALFFGIKHLSYKGKQLKKTKEFLCKISKILHLKVAALSFGRFIVFSHQFYFLLLIFNLKIDYVSAITAICSVYFISSIIPMLSLFDVVLKATIAVWIFSFLTTDNTIILVISTSMWILNFVLPAIIGCYFVLIFKPLLKK